MAAGVPIKEMVAGISCGLVTGETDDDYIVLTDMQGLEDFFGDMDFKVGGTRTVSRAIQMDIKIHRLRHYRGGHCQNKTGQNVRWRK